VCLYWNKEHWRNPKVVSALGFVWRKVTKEIETKTPSLVLFWRISSVFEVCHRWPPRTCQGELLVDVDGCIEVISEDSVMSLGWLLVSASSDSRSEALSEDPLFDFSLSAEQRAHSMYVWDKTHRDLKRGRNASKSQLAFDISAALDALHIEVELNYNLTTSSLLF
jgi:hypothetical protein